MIRVVLCQKKDAWIGFEVKGHADTAPHGEDLLCAAVSGIVTALINTLTDASDFGDQVHVTVEEGNVSLRVDPPFNEQQSAVCQTILRGFQKNMEQLGEDFPQNVAVTYRRFS